MGRFFSSVQVRTAIGATLVVAVALLATGLALLNLLQNNLAAKADAQAAAEAYNAAEALKAGADPQQVTQAELPVQIEDHNGQIIAISNDARLVRGPGPARAADLTLVASPIVKIAGPGRRVTSSAVPRVVSPSAPTTPAAGTKRGSAAVPQQTGKAANSAPSRAARPGMPAVETYRWAARADATVAGRPVTVYTAASLATETSALRTVRLGMVGGLPPLLVLVALITWLVARRALKPVEAIRREMAAITASTDLSRRVPVPPSRDEIGRLALTTNETLTALEESVERQRRFVADAAHELRNPIASLRTQLEVGAKHPKLLDLEGILEDTVRLQDLAADLLLLARLGAEPNPPPAAPVDLANLADAVVAEDEPGCTLVQIERRADLVVTGSRDQLRRAIGNLVDNARRHAASEARIVLRRDGETAVVEITDDGPGVPQEQHENVFERFVRLDDGRSRNTGGAGLGLAIARDIALHHHGTLSAHDNPTGGALFRLKLPLRADGDQVEQQHSDGHPLG